MRVTQVTMKSNISLSTVFSGMCKSALQPVDSSRDHRAEDSESESLILNTPDNCAAIDHEFRCA